MMGDADESSDDADFLLFQWDTNGDTDGTESNDEDEIIIHNSADLLQELSRLEMDEVGDILGGNDLHSVVHRINSPFLCQLLCNNETNNETNECTDESNMKSRNGCIICNLFDLRGRNNAIQHCMGSMAQCRGAGGDALREAGAISALLGILWRLICPLQVPNDTNVSDASSSILLLPTLASEPLTKNGDDNMKFNLKSLCDIHLHLQNNNSSFDGIVMNELDMTALDLAKSCLGSLRDLSCGSAFNRAAVLAWTPPSPDKQDTPRIENGVHLLSTYVKRYDQWKWEEILSLREWSCMNGTAADVNSTACTDRGKKELRLLTNTLGAIRNTSHSTPDVCQECFNHGLVDPLIWRLMPDHMLESTQSTSSIPSSSLPEASRPWREACFRAATSLINLSEKCPDVAYQLGSNRRLIYLLIEAWGGASAITFDPNKMNGSIRGLPLLHLGLAAILNAADNGALEGGLDDVMVQVLDKEKMRKRVAQRREEERKLQQMKQK
mmetsp:Transcript_8254/g.18500  ORF Transcript_8254/g.18500 Transcript_8254/m.18500 type:complete len:497 (-) Transcript_8254:308-1798(-)|eukprot:CAMPEP_0172332198 /NCGR_PEP_ID=MMETSP1058-20130122/62310_1 /TAXON_ID=83371 /ORGANISM="Detonula confervacea, Strain CCMP 353" /LENGTH=496 /DNA_ID=CAMNT_0013049475 /DNA_START=38 /DNA_END=1528 /DNA_ORIENTATION=-